jgi:pimeloyl-ACP methyl ester carboxylesterase
MSGNGYENSFLDSLRAMYSDADITFFAIDTRGRGIISDFKQGEGSKHAGSCFELFEESVYDIKGALEYLRSVGKTKFIIQGHSLGCTKAVNYLLSHDSTDVVKVILLAPTDMSGWANTEPKHQEYLLKAKQLNAEEKGEELVAAQCWLDHTPLSAQTYPTICEAGSSADIYGSRDDGALLGKVEQPMLIAYGDDDIGILRIDGSMDKWLERVRPIISQATSVAVVKGAPHSFSGYETQLTELVSRFAVAL